MSNSHSHAAHAIDEATDQAKDLADKADSKAKNLADQAGSVADKALNAIDQQMPGLKAKAGNLYRAGVDKAADLKDNTVDYVRDNPLKSVLIAAGVGVLGAMLLTRRR